MLTPTEARHVRAVELIHMTRRQALLPMSALGEEEAGATAEPANKAMKRGDVSI
jgi:hypothetical protein